MAGQSIPPPTAPKKGGFNSRSYYKSWSTETKRSCLGGFGGAAGSDTSRYDFCHDQKQTHMSQNDIRLQRCHPQPFWRKSHPVGLVVLVCFELNVLVLQPTHSTYPRSHSACSTLPETHANPNPTIRVA